jgi:hypothetical protein
VREKRPQAAHQLDVKGALANMPLVYIVLTLIIVGLALWLIDSYIPMAKSTNGILNVVVVIALCVWLLKNSRLVVADC